MKDISNKDEIKEIKAFRETATDRYLYLRFKKII